jgi:hypothetical protein
MRYALLSLALLAAPAVAVPIAIAETGEYRLILMDDPCPHNVPGFSKLAQLHEGEHKTYMACWRLNGPFVELMYEDGDQGRVPVSEFRKLESL